MSRRWWVLLMVTLLVVLLVAAIVQFAPWPPSWADAVYLGITLPFWSALSAPLVGSLAGSLSALLLIGLLLAVCFALLSGATARRAVARGLAVIVALLALSFPFTFGLGYHTTPLEVRLTALAPDGPATSVAADDPAASAAPDGPAITAAARQRARSLVLARLQEAQPPAGLVPALDASPPAASAAACLSAYLTTLNEPPALDQWPTVTIPTHVKALPRGSLLRIGFAGVISPWLLEPHVDMALPPSNALAVALHELAHTAGFAREAEAEAVGMLAGLQCDDSRVRYAAALRSASSLAAELPTAERERYLASWPPTAVADAAAVAAVASEFRSAAAARVAEQVYGSYLSSQGGEGLEDYRRATDLLVLGLEVQRR